MRPRTRIISVMSCRTTMILFGPMHLRKVQHPWNPESWQEFPLFPAPTLAPRAEAMPGIELLSSSERNAALHLISVEWKARCFTGVVESTERSTIQKICNSVQKWPFFTAIHLGLLLQCIAEQGGHFAVKVIRWIAFHNISHYFKSSLIPKINNTTVFISNHLIQRIIFWRFWDVLLSWPLVPL